MLSDSTPCEARSGTYAVLLRPQQAGRVRIGHLGELMLDGGVLVYVGSALGPGGVAARCRHHRRITDRPHWHLDYLRPHCALLGCWIAYGKERAEHRWAAALGQFPDATWPLPRFGASDCRCRAHLIRLPRAPSAQTLTQSLGDGGFCASL